MASFVSAFGLGTYTGGGSSSNQRWDYAQTFFPNIGSTGDFGLVASCLAGASSGDTLIVLYGVTGAGTSPRFSYLTGSPRAISVCAFDNYVVAFNVINAVQRVQWSQRGNPSNWTGEGSGFEDLLEMRGRGTAIRSLGENRMVLFSDEEIWYGIGATYPAQFDFNPLDPTVGCPIAATIQNTEAGLIFVGNDNTIRLLPSEGGRSQVLVPSLSREIRRNMAQTAWAVYDPRLRLYHLYPGPLTGSVSGFVVNVDTGEWGCENFGSTVADSGQIGLGTKRPVNQLQSHTLNEGLYFANSTGTVYSTNSLLANDNFGSATGVVSAMWRSAHIAPDLPGNHKQLTQINVDYRSTNNASELSVKISPNGKTFGSGRTMSLTSAPDGDRGSLDVYDGGAFPAIEITSSSTGYELHRLDVSMNLGGRA
jgi:hypothetical protein